MSGRHAIRASRARRNGWALRMMASGTLVDTWRGHLNIVGGASLTRMYLYPDPFSADRRAIPGVEIEGRP